jgi:D-serine deaminase-like pyridoxal phosphate-dependent protein
MYMDLTTPATIVDLDIVEANIQMMADRAAEAKVGQRPHVKTHKSIELAKKQIQAGAIGLTVAKLSEAELFVEAGFDNLLIAYSIVGQDKLERLQKLHLKANILTTVDSVTVAQGLNEAGIRTGTPIQVLIEMDCGTHRGGRQPGEDTVQFAKSIAHLPGIKVRGIMAYFGSLRKEQSVSGVIEAVQHESFLLNETVSLLKEAGVAVDIVSTGSTPTGLMSSHLRGATEIRSGNYIFFDASSIELGLVTEEQCALRVVATVISTPLPGKATLDAGSKTLSSDRIPTPGFGHIIGHPDVTIAALNEEHGYLEFDSSKDHFTVGQRVEIIPNHSCMLPNLNDFLYGVRKGKFAQKVAVDARGYNY